jgi:hypothetical protein
MRKTIDQVEIEERSDTRELPEGWVSASLGELAEAIQYGYTASAIRRERSASSTDHGHSKWKSRLGVRPIMHH